MENQVDSKTKRSVCQVHGEYVSRLLEKNGYAIWEPCPACASEFVTGVDYIEQQTRAAKAFDHIYGLGGIPKRFRQKTMKDYIVETQDQKEVFGFIESFVINAEDEIKKRGRSMIFCGGYGTGKTHAACMIAHEIALRYGLKSTYRTVYDLIVEIRSSRNFRSKKSEQEAEEMFIKPDLLILDEVGVQLGTKSEITNTFNILDKRYGNEKSTIIISNLGMDGVKRYLDERIVDRLRQNNGVYLAFSWDSFRTKV